MATDVKKINNYVKNLQFYEKPQAYNAIGEVIEPHCGDKLVIYILVNEKKIVERIGYELTSDACAPLFACAEVVCGLAFQKPVLTAYCISSANIAKELSDNEKLNKEHIHCAMMAELALKNAVYQYCQAK